MNRRGFVFITLLLLSLLLVTLAVVVVERTRVGAFFQIEGQREVNALYAAEAGVADALERWSADQTKTWATPISETLSNGARYTVNFSPSESVNNLNNSSATAGPRGNVPPFSAYLVVHGFCDGKERVLEVLLTRAGLLPTSDALVSRTDIDLAGNVSIDGIESLADRRATSADMVSLSNATTANQIRWDGQGQFSLSGSIASNSSSSAAISASIPNPPGGKKINQGRDLKVPLDIASRISQAQALPHTPVTLSGLETQMGPGPSVIVSPSAYSGDLVLNQTNLYVQGDLILDGSIQGSGTVFVSGRTVLRGSSSISVSDGSGVALFSRGDVELSGFNGTTYLQGLAGSVPGHLSNLQAWTARMISDAEAQLAVEGPPPTELSNPIPARPGTFQFGSPPGIVGGLAGDGSSFDAHFGVLAFDVGSNYMGTNIPSSDISPLRKIAFELDQGVNPGPAQLFMRKKFADLRRIDPNLAAFNQQFSSASADQGLFGCRPPGSTNTTVLQRLLEIQRDGRTDGILDFVNDSFRCPNLVPPTLRKDFLNRTVSALKEMDFSQPGLAYFQGTIYTEGNFVAENEIKVVGGLYAVGDQSQIILRNNCWVTYVPEVVRRSGQSLGIVSIKQWIRR